MNDAMGDTPRIGRAPRLYVGLQLVPVLKRNAVELQSSSCTIEKPHHIPIAPEAKGTALGVSFPLPLPLLVGSGFPVEPSVFRRITTSSLLIGAVGRLVAGLVSTFVIFVRRRSIPWGAWSPAAAPSVAAGSCHRALTPRRSCMTLCLST